MREENAQKEEPRISSLKKKKKTLSFTSKKARNTLTAQFQVFSPEILNRTYSNYLQPATTQTSRQHSPPTPPGPQKHQGNRRLHFKNPIPQQLTSPPVTHARARISRKSEAAAAE